MASSLSSLFPLWAWALVATLVFATTCLGQEPDDHVALFIFGDSLYDVGNNNYLDRVPQSNFPPYGSTFLPYPTGRASDGRLIPDFIAQLANLPFIPPYLEPGFYDYTNGANFASAGAGILNQTGPGTISLYMQLDNFKKVVENLKRQQGVPETQRMLANAVFLFNIGGSDYISYFKTRPPSPPPLYDLQFVLMAISNYSTVIKEVYYQGGRKFAFQNVGPLGCMPASRSMKNSTDCIDALESLATEHNLLLSQLIDRLSSFLGFKYSFFDYYTLLTQRLFDYSKFGFQVADTACCGSGPFNGNFTCGSGDYKLCTNPCDYVWFDPANPSERINMQMAQLFWSGDAAVTGPNNLKKLFGM